MSPPAPQPGAAGLGTTINPADFCRAWHAQHRRRGLRAAMISAAVVASLGLAFAGIGPSDATLGGDPQASARLALAMPPPAPRPSLQRASAAARLEPPAERLLYLAPGQTLDGLLIGAGIARADAARAAQLIGSAIFPDPIAAGTAITLVARAGGHDGAQAIARLALRPRLDLATTVGRTADGLVLTTRPIPIDASPLELQGAVGADLSRSLIAARVPARMVPIVRTALAAHVADRLRPADRFQLVFEQHRAGDGEVATGDLLYAAVKRDGRSLVELMRWRRDDGLNPVAGSPTESSRSRDALPVAGRLTSRYGMRFHPILGYTRLHAGVDVAAPWGAPVVAARTGTVRAAGWQGQHGNYVRLDHGAGVDTGYAHLSRLAVAAGQQVRGGEVIGYVGSTGLSTGPHLHYEVFRNGRPVDPLRMGGSAAATGQPPSHAFTAALASLRSLIKAP